MATVVLGVTGAVIGGATSGWNPKAMQAGWAVGTLLGAGIEGSQSATQNLNRVEDMRISGSQYGTPIPIIHGAHETSGNIIYSSELRETSRKSGVRLLGTRRRTFSYNIDLAVAWCRGPVTRVKKITADDLVIYQSGAGSNEAQQISRGTNNGGSFTVTFRGETSAAIAWDATAATVSAALEAVATIGAGNISVTGPAGGPWLVEFIGMLAGQNVPRMDMSDTGLTGGSGEGITTVQQGATKFNVRNYIGTEYQDQDPLIAAAKGASSTPAFRGTCYTVFENLGLAPWGNRIPNLVAEIEADPASLVLLDEPLLYYRFEALDPLGDTGGKLADWGSKGYDLADVGGTSTQVAGHLGQGIGSTSALVSMQREIGQDTDLQSGTATIEAWYQYKGDPIVNGGAEFAYVNPDTAEVAWQLLVSPNISTAHIDIRARIITNAEGINLVHSVQVARDLQWHHLRWTYDFPGAQSRLYHDGVLLDTETALDDPAITSDPDNHLYLDCGDMRWDEVAFFNQILDPATLGERQAETMQLRHVMADVFRQVGLTSDQWELAAATREIAGHIISTRTEARGVLQPLMLVSFVDLIEVDGLLQAVARGGVPVVTIPAEDLGCVVWDGPGGEPESLVSLRRTQDLELPLRVDLTYFNAAKSYEQDTETALRHTKGHLDNLVTVQTPLVIGADEAPQLAHRLLYDAWIAREKYQFSLPWTYSYLAPADVVNLPVGASLRRVRIMQITSGLVAGPLQLETVLDDAGVLTQVAEGGAREPAVNRTLATETVLVPWSNNAIVNADAAAVGYYVAAAGAGTGYWPGAQLFQSNDSGQTYQEVGPLDAPAIFGETDSVLAAGTTTGLFDDVNTVDVTLTHGTIESVSDAEVLAGENLFLIGEEYLHAGVVTPLGGNAYTLSHLLRGRRGTDSLWGTHAVGEPVVLLEEGLYSRVDQGFGMRGKTVLLKGVTAGATLADTAPVSLDITGDEFLSYAPVDIEGTRDGGNNLTVTWKRRTRIPEGLQDAQDEPLGEETEAYELEVPAAVPVRVISVTSETASYTAAEQTADGLTPGNPVGVVVYQIGLYGRGYGRSATV